ncbi:hypothetical protein EZV62_017006 [Acer yangbiense]|uniref:Uncharacterized protein n=1 Tax=Acer yangbiense TaxID=1000413 RepID=A0A5C7HQ45_9ROSI|nr:hypothetical protein EZV62_017006 [Acer yangbiense]
MSGKLGRTRLKVTLLALSFPIIALIANKDFLVISVTVAYTIVGDSYLSVRRRAKALNRATPPVNLAQHTYWNLGGHDSGDILSEEIQIFASHYTPVNSQMIPTGEIVSVKGTPYDFLKPHTVGSSINKLANGYNINYVLDGGAGKKMKPVANVHDKKTGRMMELWTTAPGVQFYTANFVINVTGKDGFVYQPHAALCLETQGFPDAVNHPELHFNHCDSSTIRCCLSSQLLLHLIYNEMVSSLFGLFGLFFMRKLRCILWLSQQYML